MRAFVPSHSSPIECDDAADLIAMKPDVIIASGTWPVFKTDPFGVRRPITFEGGWDETWKQVMRYRKEDTISRYDCDTSIPFRRE